MTTQVQDLAIQAQSIKAQANREVGPRVQQNASTMDSRLMDLTRLNPPMFFGSKVNEDPQDFLDEIYKIIYVMG